MHRAYLITSGLIFAAVAILHFLRLINDWALELGPGSCSNVNVMGWHRGSSVAVCGSIAPGMEAVGEIVSEA